MDGQLLLIDKPAGITSHDVVDRVRRIMNTRRVGHAGTLDPFATGLLIIGVNSATKQLTALVGVDKEYIATAYLGATSTTDDTEGEITQAEVFTPPTQQQVESALEHFHCTYEQTAPIYSAKKVGGKKLYELARKGLGHTVVLPTKLVTIHDIELLSLDSHLLTFRVKSSSGTYIRALARDIGACLGCGAYLTALRRTKIGSYDISQAQTIEQLAQQ